MSDLQAVENKLHIQTLVNTDPDFLEDKPTLQEIIADYIMFGNNRFDDFYNRWTIYKQGESLQERVKIILYDSGDDKLGRIRDLYDNEIQGLARFIAEHHKDNNFARWAYSEVMNNII